MSAAETQLPRAAYTTTEVARMVGCDPETIRDWIRSGRLHAFRVNIREFRVPAIALDAFLRRESGMVTEPELVEAE